MIPETGQFCLILAAFVAALQAWAGLRGGTQMARRAAWAQFGLCAGAFAALTLSFVLSDFTVRTVVENSHTLKPLIYKIAGVWGNHEGSMLLWVLVLSFYGAVMAWRKAPDKVIAVQGLQGVGFIAFIIFASNPFVRLPFPPLDGQDLNPLLQDPALAIHPPLLYLGYVGFSSVFSYAVAYLLAPGEDYDARRWAGAVRPWVLGAWMALSAGIAMGSWWSYYELGWGGFWFWDPVENASLMPWLCGTALLHSVMATQTRGAFPRWTVLLAIVTYSLSLLGTFLVRSGILTSVHAFAVDPLRGMFVLVLLALYTGGGLLLYARRAGGIRGGDGFQPLSRESALLLNNMMLATLAATVFIGTLYPLVLSALNLGQISVGPPYFNMTVVPLAVPLFLLMGAGPAVAWKQAEWPVVAGQLKLAVLLTLGIIVLVAALQNNVAPGVLAGLGVAAWLVMSAVTTLAGRGFRPLSAWGVALAHGGMGLAVAGMIGTTLWVKDSSAVLKTGEHLQVGRYNLVLEKVEPYFGNSYSAIIATLRGVDGGNVFTLRPERRHYPVAGVRTTEAAIRPTWHDDLYVILGQMDKGPHGEGWVVEAKTHPLVPFLWLGYALIVLGGAAAFWTRRKKTGRRA